MFQSAPGPNRSTPVERQHLRTLATALLYWRHGNRWAGSLGRKESTVVCCCKLVWIGWAVFCVHYRVDHFALSS